MIDINKIKTLTIDKLISNRTDNMTAVKETFMHRKKCLHLIDIKMTQARLS